MLAEMNTSVLVQSSACLDSPSTTTQLSMDRRVDDVEQSLRHGNNSIVSYLQERVAEFALLSKLREQASLSIFEAIGEADYYLYRDGRILLGMPISRDSVEMPTEAMNEQRFTFTN